MRELTIADLSGIDHALREENPLTRVMTGKRLRLQIMRRTADTLESELRVIECFARLRDEWRTLPCRSKLRHVLKHGVAFSVQDLSLIVDEKINTIRSSLMRMRSRGEVRRIAHGRWVV